MSEELKPCPFCQGKADYIKTEDAERYPHRVACTVCGTQTNGSAFQNDNYNAKRWNTRHITAADVPESVKLEIQAEAIEKAAFDMLDNFNSKGCVNEKYIKAYDYLTHYAYEKLKDKNK